MGEGRSRERVWERIGRVWTCGKRKCMKNQPQKQQSWHFRVCLYLEPFKSRASNLTILQKSPQKFNVFAIVADASGRLPPHRPMPYIFSRVSTLMRDIDIANLSVCPSVREVPGLDENGL